MFKKLLITCGIISTLAFGAASANETIPCNPCQPVPCCAEPCQKEVPAQLSLVSPIQTSTPDTKVKGVRFSLIYGDNVAVSGLDIGIANQVRGDMWGLQLGFLNDVGCNVTGVQWGLVNLVGGNFYGLQRAFFNRVCGDFYGIQSGLINITCGHLYGLQDGLFNSAECVQGVQLGGLNVANSVCGLQFGLVNYTDCLHGVQVGLLNIQTNRCYVKALPLLNISW